MQTVLIVDDWRRLRRRLDDHLTDAGYFTILADTGQEALGILRSLRVDLLLSREHLADIEGTVLAEIARRQGYEELVIVLEAEDGGAERDALDRGIVDAIVPRGTEVEPLVRLIRRLLRPVVCLSPPSAGFGDTGVPALA